MLISQSDSFEVSLSWPQFGDGDGESISLLSHKVQTLSSNRQLLIIQYAPLCKVNQFGKKLVHMKYLFNLLAIPFCSGFSQLKVKDIN